MSKTINACLLFSSILLNQLITSDASFQWFKSVVFLCLLFILPRVDLLNLPISLFPELISLIFGLFMKSGLQFFRDIKHSSWQLTRILFAIVLSFTMFFPSKLICFPIFLLTLLYVVVIESFSNLSGIFFFQLIQIYSFIGKCLCFAFTVD